MLVDVGVTVQSGDGQADRTHIALLSCLLPVVPGGAGPRQRERHDVRGAWHRDKRGSPGRGPPQGCHSPLAHEK